MQNVPSLNRVVDLNPYATASGARLWRPSILRNLLVAFLGLGFAMGTVFPFFMRYFVTIKPGMWGWFWAGSLTAGLIVGVACYYLVDLILISRLRRLSEVANAISHHDISGHCVIESADTIGSIANSVNVMSRNLRDVVGQITTTVTEVETASAEMHAATENTRAGVAAQQTETEQVATAMREMTVTLQEIARNVAATAQAAQRSDRETSEGEQRVKDTIDSIDALASDLENTVGVIRKLQEKSENIGTVLEVIRGIAEQTNLLALNAAIEAARAGEQGRGFAVVADEVRTLASRTQDSTQEIQRIIKDLQDTTDVSLQAIIAGNDKVQESVERAEAAGHALDAISGLVATITDMTAQIASATEEQSTVAENINRNVENINQTAQAAKNSVSQSATISDKVGQLTNRLQELLGRFKL